MFLLLLCLFLVESAGGELPPHTIMLPRLGRKPKEREKDKGAKYCDPPGGLQSGNSEWAQPPKQPREHFHTPIIEVCVGPTSPWSNLRTHHINAYHCDRKGGCATDFSHRQRHQAEITTRGQGLVRGQERTEVGTALHESAEGKNYIGRVN